MKATFLITNYRSWPLTHRAIHEVLRWSSSHVSKVVVVDDCSDAPALPNNSEKVLIHRNSRHLGYARSINVGFQFTEGPVIVLDCDAYPLMDLVPGVVARFQQNPHLGALAFFELGPNGASRIAGEREPTLASLLFGQRLTAFFGCRGWFSGRRFVAHSCCFAVRPEAFRSVSGFDENFDFLDADVDFSLRLCNAGWQVDADPNLKCFHQGCGSPQQLSERVMRFHRNRLLLLKKHNKVAWPKTVKVMLWVRHAAESGVLRLGILRKMEAHRLLDKLRCRARLRQRVWADYES